MNIRQSLRMTGSVFGRLGARATGERGRGGVVVSLLAMVGAALLLIGGAVLFGSVSLDQMARQHEERAVEHSLGALTKAVTSNVRDMAYWDDAVRNLVLSLDPDWADRNVGPYVHETFGYEVSAVVDGAGRLVYGHVAGRRDTAKAEQCLGGDLARIVQAARAVPGERPDGVFGFVAGGDGIYGVATARIVTEVGSELGLPPRPSTVLVYAKLLDRAFLEQIAGELGLNEVRLTAEPPAAASAAVALRDFAGAPIQWATWSPRRPGASQLAWQFPALGGALLVFGGLVIVVLRNIKAMTGAIRASEARFRDIAQAASDWIWETDAQLRLVYLSGPSLQTAGLDPKQALGRKLHDVMPVVKDGDGSRDHEAVLAAQAPFRGVLCQLRAGEGETRILRLAGKPIRDGRGALCGYRGTASDITSEMAALDQARYLGRHDVLTGLPNRLAMGDQLQEQLLRCRRYRLTSALLCLDLDRFKEVNDSLGHAAGDALLVACAARVRQCVRQTDTLARLGGDEFAILQSDVGGLQDVEQLAERIIACFAEPFELEGHEVLVSTSIGIALAPTDGDDGPTLLQNADIALYRAKAGGRDQYCLFEPGMDRQLRERKQMEADLRVAVATGQLEVHYQPQHDGATGSLLGVEALLRWCHPGRGAIGPAEFVPIAEDCGLIVPIGEWVLQTACRDVMRWPGAKVAVNVSPIQFRQRNLVEVVARALADSGLAPQRLELEITEGILLNNTEEALLTLRRLKSLGVRIAMDDFGTGYSSLSYLQKFPFDKIKIDKSFIATLGSAPETAAIVRAILSLGQSLGMNTCAEGVETAAQLEELRAQGCDEIQGFLLGRPQSGSAIDRLFGATVGPHGARLDPRAATAGPPVPQLDLAVSA